MTISQRFAIVLCRVVLCCGVVLVFIVKRGICFILPDAGIFHILQPAFLKHSMQALISQSS